MISPQLGFLLVSLTLGELGDGLNLFQGIYLIEIGWKESQVGIALALRGLAALLAQPMAGIWVERSGVDRRLLLAVASLGTAAGASTILWIRGDNEEYRIDKGIFFASKAIEGISASFIIPCVALLTLAQFGPELMDTVMASHMVWSQIGAVLAAIAAGIVAYIYYPNVKYCFWVVIIAALFTILFTPFLSQDAENDRSDKEKSSREDGAIEAPQSQLERWENDAVTTPYSNIGEFKQHRTTLLNAVSCPRTRLLCIIGFFFQLAHSNVLLVLCEFMANMDKKDDIPDRNTIPFLSGAIVVGQVAMAMGAGLGQVLLLRASRRRKPLLWAAFLSLPIRCALILWWRDSGNGWLLSTQIIDGIGGGLLGLVHRILVADITYGTENFNFVMGLTSSCFGLGGTLSNLAGQYIVEQHGHTASILCSLFASFIPVFLFFFMPETMDLRLFNADDDKWDESSVGSFYQWSYNIG